MKEVALIGVGRWGKNILQELVGLGCDVVVVLNSHNKEREDWLRCNYPHVAHTYDKMAVVKDNAHVTHVCIATPMHTHYTLAKAYIKAGKNVFLEKPISNRSKEGTELIRMAEAAGVELFVGHIFLYHDCFFALQRATRGRKITSVHMRKSSRVGEGALSREAFIDSFIHEISILLSLFGCPEKATYQGKESTQDIGYLLANGEFKLQLQYPAFEATIDILQEQSEKFRIFEFRTEGARYVWEDNQLSVLNGKTRQLVEAPTVSPLRKELDVFLNGFALRREEIRRNNYTAVEAVRLLESLAA